MMMLGEARASESQEEATDKAKCNGKKMIDHCYREEKKKVELLDKK